MMPRLTRAWYISIGQRDKGEELLARALARNPDEMWHYVRAAEALLKVPPSPLRGAGDARSRQLR